MVGAGAGCYTRGMDRLTVASAGCAAAVRRWWPLAALTAAVTLLAAAGVLPRWPGLVHAVALPPADVFTDLRVLLARASTTPAFLAGAAVALAARVVVLSLLLGGLDRARLRLAARYYAVAALPLLLAAQLEFIAQAVLYSRLLWAGVALLALVWLVLAPVPWQTRPPERGTPPRRAAPSGQAPPPGRAAPSGQAPPPGRAAAPGSGGLRLRSALRTTWRRGGRVAVLVPYAVALLLLGALADVRPGWVVALVPVSAALTAAAIAALTRPPRGRPGRRLAAAAAASALLATVFVATRGGEGYGPRPAAREGSLLLMSGINSASGRGAIFETENERLGYTCDQTYYFSYAGPGPGQPRGVANCPIRTGRPYVEEDTQRPVDEQVAAFAEQVRGLPRPLVVAAHSHAVWVAWQAVADGLAEVDVLVLVGPFPSSPLGYPPPGEPGEGRVAGDLLRLMVPLAELVDFTFRPDAPAARELLATPYGAEAALARPLPPDVRALGVTSATDLPLMPDGWRLPVERNACPQRVAHTYLPIRAPFVNELNRFLDHRPPLPCPPWRDWGAPLTRPFTLPPHTA